MDNSEKLAGRIEKLILDGQKEVVDRLMRLEEGQSKLEEGQNKLEEGQNKLEEGQRGILAKIDAVHTSLKQEIDVSTKILDHDIKEVGRKLDEHVRQPA